MNVLLRCIAIIALVRSITGYYPPSLKGIHKCCRRLKHLQAVSVFNLANAQNIAGVAALVAGGIVPYFIFNSIVAPRLGMSIDAEVEEGKGPGVWVNGKYILESTILPIESIPYDITKQTPSQTTKDSQP